MTKSIQSFPRRVAVLGSSGSIGRNALEVIAGSKGLLVPVLLSVHTQTDVLAEQIRQMALRGITAEMQTGKNVSAVLPRWLVVTGENADRDVLKGLPKDVEVLYGQEALCELVRRPEIDTVLSGIVGSAGLTSTWAAIEAGKTVALANKEALVMGGQLLTNLAKQTGGQLIPVDSEHSALMQALRSKTLADNTQDNIAQDAVERIILTASGGPFRTWTLEALRNVTVKDALKHPVWKMGRKITVDSATLMNKALEIIEARWLFDIPAKQIDIVIHPQSLIHSMVEFTDGSVIAQVSKPDMRLPIQTALTFPYRFPSPALKMDWTFTQTLDFYPPDLKRFPAIPLGWDVAERGGSAGAVVNAANETAVNAFLAERLPFDKIVSLCKTVLESHNYEPSPTLERLLQLDAWARTETEKVICGTT
ncbi:MAG: 1-deoxy-D-xylulose-5-phosphate reductoisomerase [Planctomycetaceae bacterium]|jgi:1-deoxy-D-xylulose-5-phosphate reductoisomerase|nr:1-deoxy-D-xylulose-5-phosphate reductoisomerase [Planctomycetaceae bacterium]